MEYVIIFLFGYLFACILNYWHDNKNGIEDEDEIDEQTELLKNIYKEIKRNSDLVEAYNKQYHVK
tara:strand:- start:244 stop:438 length:195 start_codon:yes stop_codon:yes gene_type:complete